MSYLHWAQLLSNLYILPSANQGALHADSLPARNADCARQRWGITAKVCFLSVGFTFNAMLFETCPLQPEERGRICEIFFAFTPWRLEQVEKACMYTSGEDKIGTLRMTACREKGRRDSALGSARQA